MKTKQISIMISLALSLMVIAACKPKAPAAEIPASSDAATTQAPVTPETGYPERAYFGDTHVHTGWSFDAGLDGAVTSPEDAFRLASGAEVTSNSGQMVKLQRPLDWMVITDHSDGMGTINEVQSGNPEMIADPFLNTLYEAMKGNDPKARGAAVLEVINRQSNGNLPKQVMDPKWMVSAWQKTAATADKYNKPGTFTAMIGYEWTSNAGGGDNLHRNVIYRDDASFAKQMIPFTTFQSEDAEKLWDWMAAYEQKTGGKVLAIPHNGNLSNGRMFEETRFDGSPMTAEYAQNRQRWERLFELTQIKGQSESHPSLSPGDEFASWDMWDTGNLNGVVKKPGMIRTEYYREALKSGLRLEAKLGANPFKYGAQSGTDTHTGLATAEENNFWGKFKNLEPRAGRWQPVVTGGPGPGGHRGWEQSAAGYTGVWATSNTRAAIWDAMMRRETFSTTGPRMTVRFFGGYDFADSDAAGDVAKAGYSKGVPMGGDLKAAPAGKKAGFLIAAMKDPDGANLDRVQVIKGWLGADGKTHEKIYEVVWAGERKPDAAGKLPPVGNTVDMAKASYANSIGAAQLIAHWADPDFDPALKAVYYARVLEIPTPRWTAYDQMRFKDKMPDNIPTSLQERAFTSPIWYSPN
ncbi:DUF3604 domain-containing protein [Arenimonas sp.]|jgi:hypothetical protein|uniref:DUF3604 domain-containing protein n=1 Tax=Arenimonas sp. TaxID=1872635 RepID=UPI0037BE87E6